MKSRVQNRPAETTGVGAAVALLIGYFAGIHDAGVIAALAVVVGFLPAAITWIITTTKGRP